MYCGDSRDTIFIEIRSDGGIRLVRPVQLKEQFRPCEFTIPYQFSSPLHSVKKKKDSTNFNLLELWRDSPDRRIVEKILYDASQPPGWNAMDNSINMYRPSDLMIPPSMSSDDAKRASTLFFEHIEYIWCGGHSELYDYVMNWLAWAFKQKTWKKTQDSFGPVVSKRTE